MKSSITRFHKIKIAMVALVSTLLLILAAGC